jgi:hypothetical protein
MAKVGGKKTKRPDNRPARKRYWLKRVLESRKIRNLMKAVYQTDILTNIFLIKFEGVKNVEFIYWSRNRFGYCIIPNNFC